VRHNPKNQRRKFVGKHCRHVGCRRKTRNVYTVVIAPGEVRWVHLCDEHHALERDHGWTAIELKPVVAA
jgi:hypothetical protein